MRIVLNRPSNVVAVIPLIIALLALIGLVANVPLLTGNVLLFSRSPISCFPSRCSC